MYQHLVASRDSAAAGTPSTANDTTTPSKTRGAFQTSAGATGIPLPTAAHRWVARRVGVKLATTGTVQPAVQVNLRDSGAGAGNILDSWQIGVGLSTALMGVNCVNIDENDLYFPGIANQAMTLEFSAATAAATTAAVFLQGFPEIPD